MSTYREIKGKTVQSLTSDPPSTAPTSVAGQIWFNTTENVLKTVGGVGAWASSGDMNNGRKGGHFSFGTGTAAIAAGGTPPTAGQSEQYNGSSWTNLPTINSVRYGGAGAGTTTAGLIFGSASPTPLAPATESWNGSAWTSVNSLNTGHGNGAGGGIQTAAWVAGGGPSLNQVTEEFDGTNWAAGGSMTGTARYGWFGSGPQTASIAGGGQYPPGTQFDGTEEYDGTSWAAGGTISDSRGWAGSSGDSSSDIIFGGNPGSGTYTTGETEQYNGISWTTLTATLGDARNDAYSAGTTTASAMTSGGEPVPIEATTENWTFSTTTPVPAAWSAGGNMSRSPATYAMGGCGTQTAALAYSGQPGSVTTTETYDGSSWTASPNSLNTGRPADYNNNVGNQTAALQVGCSPGWGGEVESWNGTTWSVNPTSITGRGYACSFGSQTAALCAGGYAGPGWQSYVEDWNGTTWTEVGDLGSALYGRGGAGTPAAAVVEGGAPGVNTTVESFDGTSWTAGTAFPTANNRGNMSGIQTDAISIGGQTPGGGMTECNFYDGSTWTTTGSLATARYGTGTGGTTGPNSLCFGGDTPPATVATEELTAGYDSLNVQTIGTS